MDPEQHLRDVAAWLVQLADNPLTSGKNGYAAHRLKELMRDSLYAELPKYIREERASTSGRPLPVEGSRSEAAHESEH